MDPDAQDLCFNNARDSPEKAKKTKQPFLKRGEGVSKRLNAYKYRGTDRTGRKAATDSAQDTGDVSVPDQHVQEIYQQARASRTSLSKSAAFRDDGPQRSLSPGFSDELQADTFMLGQSTEAGTPKATHAMKP